MPLRDVVVAHVARPRWGPILPVRVSTAHMPAPLTPVRSLVAGKAFATQGVYSDFCTPRGKQGKAAPELCDHRDTFFQLQTPFPTAKVDNNFFKKPQQGNREQN